MKLQASGVMMLALIAMVVQAYESGAYAEDMAPYVNQVTEIEEFAGATNYTLVLRCQQEHPIVTYAPTSFAQSQDNSIHRYILPNTTLCQDINNDLAHVVQSGSHVEILLFGRLIAQTADDHTVVFMVKPTN